MKRIAIAVEWLIALAIFVWAYNAYAQTDWQPCAGENEQCVFSGTKLVRYGDPGSSVWTEPRSMTGPVACNNATFGDPVVGTYKQCFTKDAPIVTPPPANAVSWTVSWQHATTNTDGSALTNRTGYRIESNLSGGAWESSSTVSESSTSAVLSLSSGTRCFRVVTLSSGGESLPSSEVCKSKTSGSTPSPLPPGPPSVSGVRLDLVNGATTGLRAVYARTSTGSRGTKIGDLAVGPTTQTEPPFDRVRCNLADSFLYGSIRYARVIDQRVATQYRTGYVSGCVSVGVQ